MKFLTLITLFVLTSSFTIQSDCVENTQVDITLHTTCIKNKEDGKLPESTGLVTDFESILTKEELKKLAKKIKKFKKNTTNEIAILTVKNFAPYENIDDYSLAIFNQWGIGLNNKKNGVLIVVSKESRTVRITTGTGVEPVLTDAKSKKINETIMIPHFKKGNYFEGLNAGVDAVMKELIAN